MGYKAELLGNNIFWDYCIYDEVNMEFPKEINKYLKLKKMQNKSKNTIRDISRALSYYLNYLNLNMLSFNQVINMDYYSQYSHFTEYLLWLKMGNHTQHDYVPLNNTCNSYLKKVFGFYQYYIRELDLDIDLKVLDYRTVSFSRSNGVREQHTYNHFDGYLEADRNDGKSIYFDEVNKLIEAEKNTRNKLILLILVNTGMRIGEILGIKLQDIDFENHKIEVVYRNDNTNNVFAKNAENRELFIRNDTFNLLVKYIAENRELFKKTDFLFINLQGKTKGEAMTISNVYSFFKNLTKRTGIKATPHMFRHFFANSLRKEGVPKEVIQWILGHRKYSTTERYFNIQLEETREAQRKYFENNKCLYNISELMG